MGKASGKKVESAKRQRYIRVLERFSSSIITYLTKTEEASRDAFDKKIDNNKKYLERTEPVPLYKGDFNDLEQLVQKMIAFREGDEPIDTIRETLLYQANQLEKTINARRYKKDKHTSDKFRDWD